MTVNVDVATGLSYGPGAQSMDVYRSAPSTAASPAPEPSPPAAPAVLLWHGRGPDERDVLATVARTAAELGVVVFVPDWRPDAPDAGRSHLAESVAFVRENALGFGADPERMVLAGWSLGANAAVGVALDPAALGGWRPRAVVGIAGRYRAPAPTTGTVPVNDLARAAGPVPPIPVHLAHGTADAIVDIEQSRELRDALEKHDWPVPLTELASDHAGVVMTEFSPEHQRCLPSTADHAVEAGTRTARLLAHAAGLTDS